VTARPTLLFVSTQFLFPVNTGGRIRTTQILRGLKGGRFRIVLAMPATTERLRYFRSDIQQVADEVVHWEQGERGMLFHYTRLRHVLHRLPIPIRTDLSNRALEVVEKQLAAKPAVVVFDFLHGAVLSPRQLGVPSVLFTHNVEAEIFKRHLSVARNPFMRALWRSQFRKIEKFERHALSAFDRVVAVSERDKQQFEQNYGAKDVEVIPTGVDLDYFKPETSGTSKTVVFTGSMDWLANIDGLSYFMDEVWPLIVREEPNASMVVVGRSPPADLVRRAEQRGYNWTFTYFVRDIRPHVAGASAFIIPLRVGGGTRLKVFEAMAMGCPVVSTTIGVEGLPVVAGEHYLLGDDAAALAKQTVALLRDPERGRELAGHARAYVENNCSYRNAAGVFEEICLKAMSGRAG
jgi:glycosyltransferase involved in cell wall biosynthesis